MDLSIPFWKAVTQMGQVTAKFHSAMHFVRVHILSKREYLCLEYK